MKSEVVRDHVDTLSGQLICVFFFFNFDHTRPDGMAGQTLLAWRVCD